MKLLHVDSSILGDGSVSRQLSAAVVSEWRTAVPELAVVYRDLDAEPLPHLDSRLLAAAQSEAAADETTRTAVTLGARTLEEFLEADVVVVGAPMYNFGVPSQLKAWIDRLAVAGKTFAYTESGPKGLAGGKKVIVASARGGLYTPGSPQSVADFQEPYLKAIFGFLGIDDVTFVRAEGVAQGADQRQQAVETALRDVPTPIAA